MSDKYVCQYCFKKKTDFKETRESETILEETVKC